MIVMSSMLTVPSKFKSPNRLTVMLAVVVLDKFLLSVTLRETEKFPTIWYVCVVMGVGRVRLRSSSKFHW